MVFSSLPIYLDPPNWNQHQAPNQAGSGCGGGGGGGGGEAQQLPPGLAASHPEAGMTVAVRPGSMAERARLAKIPQPEPALKCPRCDSTNTKFCYFNNYSLSQPRHFCKTCRRYWTRGGALRNVPVGGGCRRNKRNKAGGSSSKSSATATTTTTTTTSTSSTATSGGAIPSNIMPPPQLSFMSSLHPLADYSTNSIGLNYSGIQPIDTVDYQLGSSSSFGLDQWRIQQIQQFPFLGGLDHHPQQPSVSAPGMGLFPFDAEVGADGYSPQVLPKVSGSELITQLASVKMEDSPQGFSLPRQYLGITGNDQYWGNANTGSNSSSNAGWALDYSGFNSSSSGNLL